MQCLERFDEPGGTLADTGASYTTDGSNCNCCVVRGPAWRRPEHQDKAGKMKLSTKGRYAVMALADIARHSAGSAVSLADVARRQEISVDYLEQLFGKLRRAGLVDSVRGPGGGYLLAMPAEDIWIADIISAVDEAMQVTRCQGDAIEGCVGGEKCVTHELWAALGRQIYGFLAAVTLGDVVEQRNLALAASVRRAKAFPVRAAG
jgi:Rrf2 family iron-sulfur cluster assembly transcriptional regulator